MDDDEKDQDERVEQLADMTRLARDVRAAGAMLGRDQARELVALYYRVQEHRISLNNQSRALEAADPPRPHSIVDHFGSGMGSLERQAISVLDVYSMTTEVGRWSRSVLGIGPVLAAGLMAHIDIERAPTVGHIWRFAGLDPTVKWGKGEKRPWNAELKVLCWKIGDSFVKLSGREDAFYGQIYRDRKKFEVERDVKGGNARGAAETLETRRFTDKATKALYESGHMPPGRLDLRARRYATKLFLSHWHFVAFREQYGVDPPLPYILTKEGGHAHFIAPPGYRAAGLSHGV